MWLSIVVIQFVIAGILVAQGVNTWNANPIVTVTDLVPLEEISFPGITLCPQGTVALKSKKVHTSRYAAMFSPCFFIVHKNSSKYVNIFHDGKTSLKLYKLSVSTVIYYCMDVKKAFIHFQRIHVLLLFNKLVK